MARRRRIHGRWSNHWTFIMAATGAAAGLGNVWKFPYIAGMNGGGAFVLLYLLCVIVVALPIMTAEIVMGLRGRQSPVNALRNLALEAGASRWWQGVGWLGVIAGLLVLSFYSVVAGWVLEYGFAIAQGEFRGVTLETAVSSFDTLMDDQSQLIKWQSVFMLMTMVVVIAGVRKGLAIAVNLLVPLLLLSLFVMVYYSIEQGDISAALHFLLGFHYQQLSWQGLLVALGHGFLSLSIGMGAIMAYGAYLPDKAPVGRVVISVAVLDTLIALLAGVAIFAIVFAHPTIEPSEGPGLLFISLPVAFGNMPGGLVFGTLFFALMTIATWSSAIALLEPAVAWLIEARHFHRVSANLLLGFLVWLLGLGTVYSFHDRDEFRPLFGMTFFDFLGFITTNIMLPLSGVLIAFFVGWVMRRETVRQVLKSESLRFFQVWLVLLRYFSPVVVIIIFSLTLLLKF